MTLPKFQFLNLFKIYCRKPTRQHYQKCWNVLVFF